MTSKIHPVHVKNTHCYKTFLVKHFLFGALAWQTVDVRHKPFLFSHLACSLLQWGAPLRPGPKHWSGRHEVPTLPAPVSLLLLFLQNSCAWMVLFWQRIFFFFFLRWLWEKWRGSCRWRVSGFDLSLVLSEQDQRLTKTKDSTTDLKHSHILS